MAEFPKPERCKPDFMAPGPKTAVLEDFAQVFDEDFLQGFDEEAEFDTDLFPGHRKPRYYKSNAALGQLFREIDEKAFHEELEKESRALSDSADTNGLMKEVWNYVMRETNAPDYEHLIPWAAGVRLE